MPRSKDVLLIELDDSPDALLVPKSDADAAFQLREKLLEALETLPHDVDFGIRLRRVRMSDEQIKQFQG